MRWIKPFIITISFLLFSCEIVEAELSNPLDVEYNNSKGITPPAFVFSPDEVSSNSGSNVTLKVNALEVSKVAGAHIQIKYDQNKLSVNSVSQGDWLIDAGQSPVFFYEDDPLTGMINIYYSILADSEDLSGTGVVAFIIFNISAPGQTTVQLTSTTKIVDKENQEIQLNGLGNAVINAQ